MAEALGKGNIFAAFKKTNASQNKENDTPMTIFVDEENQEETDTLKRRRVATPARKTPSARASGGLRSDTMQKFGSTQIGNGVAIQQILAIVQKLVVGQEGAAKEIKLLQEENQELKEILTQQTNQLAAASKRTSTSQPTENTWATVARGRNGGQKNVYENITVPVPQNVGMFRDKVVVITLGKATGEVEKIPITILQETLQNELQKENKTENIKIIGVAKPNKGRLEVTLESKEQAVTARANKRWTHLIGEGAKLKDAAWHPLKIDGVAREAMCSESGNGWEFKEDILQIVNESNSYEGEEVKAMKIHWLSKISEKTVGSIAVYFETAEMRDMLLERGVVIFGDPAATLLQLQEIVRGQQQTDVQRAMERTGLPTQDVQSTRKRESTSANSRKHREPVSPHGCKTTSSNAMERGQAARSAPKPT
ncbi:hypothetical protein V501_01078 [Pseudogymnoascus sp. VKM F-4519 (FW-2642)]|nr:hypothetical protein V501_01078 [Pseudogymnoascus sp. VKM F-4519 (FW-2642)]